MSEEQIAPDNRFVCRLMCAKCSYGSMSHPLNVAASKGGHGVLLGPDAQPVLNANDFKPDVNVIHFGDCSPRVQDEEGNRVVDEMPGFFQFLSDVGAFFNSKKCTPMIDRVWYETDHKYTLDGAPALLMRSMLFCKKGGIITIELPVMQDDQENNQEEVDPKAAIEAENAKVSAAVDQALAEGKIDSETAQFMKDGFSAALDFTGGDVEAANKIFNDMTRLKSSDHTTDFQYSSSEPEYEKFELFLEHRGSDLVGNDVHTMELTSSSGDRIDASSALMTSNLNEQRVAGSLDKNGEPKEPIEMSQYIETVRTLEEAKYTITDENGIVYDLPLPERMTSDPDPDNLFSFLDEKDVPQLFQGANVSETAVSIADEIAKNPSEPVVVSLLNGLG